MNPIYILDTNDYIYINSYINKILKEKNVSNDALTKYDLLVTPVEKIIEDLDTYNFLFPTKVAVCDNAYFLTSLKPKVTISHNIESLERYIANPNMDNILIFICDGFEKKNKLSSKLLSVAKVVEKPEANTIDDMIKLRLEDYSMDFRTTKYLINYCNSNNERILNEIEKLKMYVYPQKEITIDDINKVVIKLNEADIFKFIDYAVTKNRQGAIKLYKDLLANGEDVSKLIVMLADQYRLILQCISLLSKGMDKDSISSTLKVHPYKAKLAIEKSYQHDAKQLHLYLSKLASIDLMIKSGKGNGINNFELFLNNI